MTKSGPQLTASAPIDIAIVCYPGSQATSIHGLTDLFTYAEYFARVHAGVERSFVRVTHWMPGSDGAGLECKFDTAPGLGAHGVPALVIVPACSLAPPPRELAPGTIAWVSARHADGARVAAVCGGVFLLAESGLLDGRRVTTHWMFADELQRRFPGTRVDADRLVIDDNDVITAGGVLAWADMGLSLVEKLFGRTVMCSTARFMLMDPPGREQRFYGEFTPPLQHGDKAILGVQHWMQAHLRAASSVSGLADRAGLGARTFLRRFVKATGLKPSEYHQRLRIARSRELLEFSRQTVEQIAVAAGYEDPGGFRRVFKRVIGLSPAEYRRRFQRAS
ncbi:MAG TPA: GlxA family transcriptional regulator [Steroidobacteraceae bacterium]|nr:GlxA family transcriptional regulator [Steroidobacteraceae bacterium]